MNNPNWYWVYTPDLDPPERQHETALKAGYNKVYFKSEADKVITHHKYKRCLAMARWCNERHTFNETNEKRTWLHKWHKRWLELAEKFKPNKE